MPAAHPTVLSSMHVLELKTYYFLQDTLCHDSQKQKKLHPLSVRSSIVQGYTLRFSKG